MSDKPRIRKDLHKEFWDAWKSLSFSISSYKEGLIKQSVFNAKECLKKLKKVVEMLGDD